MDSSSSPVFVSTSPNAPQEVTSHLLSSRLKGIKKKLRKCDKNHSCKERNGSTLPTRLLHVGRHGTDEVRVVTSSDDIEPTRSPPTPYAALSYCWGTCTALKLTRSNLSSRMRGFSISDMPLTLRDAVRVTRELGLLYLWVDALCILQDCKEDWQRESDRMAEVYGHAYVTIFAFGARNCEGGLFSPADHRTLPKEEKPRFRFKFKPLNRLVSSANRKSGKERLNARFRFKDEPLNQRAWALQEWQLSSRRLIFTSYDAIFDCLQGEEQDWYRVYSHRFLGPSTPQPRDWELLVMNYSSRELTNPMDKLPAIAGLAHKFEELSNGRCGRYFAGLWEADLPCSLLWHRISVAFTLPQPNSAKPAACRAPSWSWASINGTVEFVRVPSEEQDSDVVAQVINVDVRSDVDSDPHSFRPTIYTLLIRSRMKSFQSDTFTETKPQRSTGHNEGFTDLDLYTEGSDPMKGLTATIWGDCVMRPFIEGSGTLQFCAIMTEKLTDSVVVWGLLLVEVDHAKFQRIGCGWCLSSWFEDAEEAAVEII